MWPRLSIVAGLLAGIGMAALVLGGILLLAPLPAAAPTPAPEPSGTFAARPSPTEAAAPSAGVFPSASPAGSAGSAEPAAAFHVGEPAPPLAVAQVGGGTIDLANLKGSPVWVNFMGTYCPSCVDEFPLMNGFLARYADEGLVIVAIDVKEDEGTVAAFAEQLGAMFPFGLDSDGSAAARWDAVALPVHFWVDKDGVIRDGALGGIGADLMARGLRAIMPGVDVQP